MKKNAIILFNLGGPTNVASIRPFLFNLFNDKAIITYPQPFRWILAQLISRLRYQKARGIYNKIGDKSPLLELTKEQAIALEQRLQKGSTTTYKVFVCMRYWEPFAPQVIDAVKAYAPDHITLLPLYPHFSTTTTGSSLDDWQFWANKKNLKIPTSTICCYPVSENFIKAHVDLIRPCLETAKKYGPVRLVFSAHSLPQKVVDDGDPYQWQIEQTAAAILNHLNGQFSITSSIAYQSKVGPMRWLSPSLEEILNQAAQVKESVVICPISFVSDHSETLVELDIDYREKSQNLGIPFYTRVPALACHPNFIDALAHFVSEQCTVRNCTSSFKKCFCNT